MLSAYRPGFSSQHSVARLNYSPERLQNMESTNPISERIPSKRRRSRFADDKVVFWNLLLMVLLSSLLLLTYLKRIIFDF